MDSTSYTRAVASNARAAIDASGLTVVAVAAQSGIPRATLLRRLDAADPTKPLSALSVTELKALADLLGTSARDLATVRVVIKKSAGAAAEVTAA